MKLPPYGKQLRQQRDAGDHPARIAVCFTRQWIGNGQLPDTPSIMVPPADYEPGVYDFSILAGLPAHVVVDVEPEWWPESLEDPTLSRPHLQLAIEVARYAAPVMLYYLATDHSQDFGELIYCCRYGAKGEDKKTRLVWPANWSDQLQLDYDRRCDRVLNFYANQEERQSA